ncbi:MAG: ABC transporter ATP-binding protein [Oscillospiraceae bacterium]|nr:ABC transporter ATP-binding protein [Oscillospiraceae bacterium]
MLSVHNLTKRYGDRAVVDNLCFSLNPGEVTGLLGPNGAGKTTTMNMLAGFLAPTGGSVTVDGIDARRDALAAARHIGFLPDTPPLYPEMTVLAYLDFVYRLKGVAAVDKKAHLAEACDAAGISGVLPRVIGRLSRGYRQRVGLAAALIGDPDILILDEPTVGLDPKQIRDLRSLILELGRSRSILISTHILPEVNALCSRVLVMHHGVIVADGKPSELGAPARDGGEYCVIRVADGQGANALRALRALREVSECRTRAADEDGRLDIDVRCAPDSRPLLTRTLTGAGVDVYSIQRARRGLEDVFLSLTLDDAAGGKAKNARRKGS